MPKYYFTNAYLQYSINTCSKLQPNKYMELNGTKAIAGVLPLGSYSLYNYVSNAHPLLSIIIKQKIIKYSLACECRFLILFVIIMQLNCVQNSQKQNLISHSTSLDNFSIVGREDQNLMRLIKEAIYIRVNSPSLNKNIGKYHLPHIWDEVLNNITELKLK